MPGEPMKEHYDVIIVGSGIAGLNTCLHLDTRWNVLLLSKDSLIDTNTALAQGGISVLRDPSDRDDYVEDTMKAGQYSNNREAVEILVGESRKNITELLKRGVPFNCQQGQLHYTREGGHSKNRILHVDDETGKHISKVMLEALFLREKLDIQEHATLVDLIQHPSQGCIGVLIDVEGEKRPVFGKSVVLATGGVGGLFQSTTNQISIKGDGIGIALKNEVKCEHLEQIQFHPTVFYKEQYGQQKFLITEAVRGEGAVLINDKGHRFVEELSPRDVVCDAIWKQMRCHSHVYLDVTKHEEDFLRRRFPNVFDYCQKQGIRMDKQPIPVVPAQHYIMGGIAVDTMGRTSLPGLYAAGETAHTGVHGKNRLASNSLLEGLVFSRRLAQGLTYTLTQSRNLHCANYRWSESQWIPFDPGEQVRCEIRKGTNRYDDLFQTN